MTSGIALLTTIGRLRPVLFAIIGVMVISLYCYSLISKQVPPPLRLSIYLYIYIYLILSYPIILPSPSLKRIDTRYESGSDPCDYWCCSPSRSLLCRLRDCIAILYGTKYVLWMEIMEVFIHSIIQFGPSVMYLVFIYQTIYLSIFLSQPISQ